LIHRAPVCVLLVKVLQSRSEALHVITRNCPRCDAPLDLDVDATPASTTCRYCGCSLRLVREGSDRDYRLEELLDRREPAVVPRPDSIQVDESAGGLLLSWRWFTPALIFLVFFCIGWNAFLLVWYGAAFGFGGMAPWPFRLLMFLFPLVHVAVGVGLTYFTVAGLFNTTRIAVDRGVLRVSHGPIPWKLPPELPVDQIDQIYVTQSATNSERGRSFGYAVNVLDADGGTTPLLKRMTDAGKALYVADRLRRHLDIDRRPVAGEFVG
jgi:hypothetical protein